MTTQANRELAARCRALADTHPGGSLPRRAALCCNVVLTTARTTRAARQALAGVHPDDVRDAATALCGWTGGPC